jgi:glucose-1-phosphate thymidylyltransferase
MILLKQVPDPQRYGVALLDGDKVIEIQEKPENPPTSFALQVSIFMILEYFQPFEI